VTAKPFEQIVKEHGSTVFRVCRAVLIQSDAEDAWSDTFVAAIKAYPDLPADANVEAWLVTIAHRKAIDVLRATARGAVAVERVPERAAPVQEWHGDLWAAVGELPAKQRFAVAYHYLAGLPYKEIAAITGSTTDATRRAAADGVKSLRAAFATSARGEF
jgi:RNA polymerase sigma factor (sigma-70 family)